MDNFTIAVIIGAAAVCIMFGLMFMFDMKKPEPAESTVPPSSPVKPTGPVKAAAPSKPARKRSA